MSLRDDFGSRAGTSGSYAGNAGTANGGVSGGGGGNTGLRTGTTVYGNTAYGPAGGNVAGYATRDAASLASAGMGPTMGIYSNFMNPNGTPAYGGALSGQSAYAPNAQAGFNTLSDAYNYAQNSVQSSPLGAPAPTSLNQYAPVVQAAMPPIPTARPMRGMGMPVSYNPMSAAVGPNYFRSTVRMGNNFHNPQYSNVGNLGDYGTGSGMQASNFTQKTGLR